jgi:hypothetical protein
MELESLEWWRTLTTIPAKYEAYARETYFREAWSDICDVLASEAEETLQGVAIVTFKPEAVVGRRICNCLAYLRRHQYLPIAWRRLRYTRHIAREAWRYQWNVATLDRLMVADLMNGATESLFLLLADTSSQQSIPATVRLRGLKGSALPWVRQAHQLRAVLGGSNRMMTFVHCADEPIDVVREVGIFFGRDDRRTLLAEVQEHFGRDRFDDLMSEVDRLEADYPEEDLSLAAALDRFEAPVRPPPSLEAEAARQKVRTMLMRAKAGEALKWATFAEEVAQAGLDVTVWDSVIVGAQFVQHDVENLVCTIDDDGRPEWLAGQGRMVPERNRMMTGVNGIAHARRCADHALDLTVKPDLSASEVGDGQRME